MKKYIILGVVVLLLGFAGGYLFSASRQSAKLAGYEKREQQRMDQIKANDAAQDQLRGENKQLRERVAEQSAKDEAMVAIIESRGGQIAAEAKNLEAIHENLKTNLQSIGGSTDPCTWCRQFSADSLARKQIAKPLACADECAGTSR